MISILFLSEATSNSDFVFVNLMHILYF
jgi:hypothetical protein